MLLTFRAMSGLENGDVSEACLHDLGVTDRSPLHRGANATVPAVINVILVFIAVIIVLSILFNICIDPHKTIHEIVCLLSSYIVFLQSWKLVYFSAQELLL